MNKNEIENKQISREQFEQLKLITRDMKADEQVRLLKIIAELLKINGISLKFLSALYLADQESNQYYVPNEVGEIQSELITIDCDVETGRITTTEFVKKIENALEKYYKRKGEETLEKNIQK